MGCRECESGKLVCGGRPKGQQFLETVGNTASQMMTQARIKTLKWGKEAHIKFISRN